MLFQALGRAANADRRPGQTDTGIEAYGRAALALDRSEVINPRGTEISACGVRRSVPGGLSGTVSCTGRRALVYSNWPERAIAQGLWEGDPAAERVQREVCEST